MRPLIVVSVVLLTAISLFSLPLTTWQIIGLYGVALFLVCVLCHGALAILKPSGTFLTDYYLMIAVGGVVGGIFVNIVAPRIYQTLYELVIGTVGAAIIAFAALWRETRKTRFGMLWLIPGIAMVAGAVWMGVQ